MDNRYDNQVLEEMKPVFDEQGFTARQDGSFQNEKKAYRVSYDASRQMYVLQAAEVTDGTVGDFAEVSAWLFDDSQTEKDAHSVGIDFAATVREQLGVRVKRAAGAAVDLPTAEKNGALTVSGFTKKVLDIYPQFKEDYKSHVAVYGNFLYLDFFGKTLVPQMRTVLTENNKKSVKKLIELVSGAYMQGDRETANVAVALLTAASFEHPDCAAALTEALTEQTVLKSAYEAFIPMFARNKALRTALLAE
ncbi:MAG: hypothetical protein IKI29_04385 [Clostridia bacterium]|nr:hypothetical protein [Clostridia bacterium]